MPVQSSSISLILIGICVAVGAALTTQSGINARLSAGLHSPVLAALASFGIGTLVLIAMAMAMGHFSHFSGFQGIPLWAWSGGVLGAFIVAGIVYVAPQVGALALAGGIVLGQVIASLIFDQFGFLGYPQIQVTPSRIAGALLILVGLWLVSNK